MSTEIEELRNRRTGLEEESRSLAEERKNLEERLETLEQRIAIEQLNSNNKSERKTISQLKSKLDDLEQRLKDMTQAHEHPEPATEQVLETPEPPAPSEETTPEITTGLTEEPEEEMVTVAPLEDAGTRQDRDETTRSEKKRRKFF